MKTDDLGTLLEEAIQNRREPAVARLLKLGANPTRANAWGSTPLHLAAGMALPKIVRRLLQAGADAATVTSSGNTALHDLANGEGGASATDRLATMKLLLDAGCPLDACDRAGRSALFFAAATGTMKPPPAVLKARLTVLEALLEAGADPCAGALKETDRRAAFVRLIGAARGLDQPARYRVVWPEAVTLLTRYAGLGADEVPPSETAAELQAKKRSEAAADQREARALTRFLKKTVKDLAAARGNAPNTAAAIDAYLEEGSALGCSPSELWDHFAVSSPGLPEKAGFSGAELKAVLRSYAKRSKQRHTVCRR